jgi:GT2 family glycosyltransferase
MWMKLGGMSEKLFKAYWEDVDLSYRAQKRGWRVVWEPSGRVEHKHETTYSRVMSQKQRQIMQETNQLVFNWKNITSGNLMRKHISGLIKRVSKNPGYIRVVLRAVLKWRLIWKARKKEFKEAKISDEAIISQFS